MINLNLMLKVLFSVNHGKSYRIGDIDTNSDNNFFSLPILKTITEFILDEIFREIDLDDKVREKNIKIIATKVENLISNL